MLGPKRHRKRRLAGRTLFLLVSLISLYVLLPSLLEVFTSWRELFELSPGWVAVALGVEALSFLAIWELQRIALQAGSWFPVSTSQLAGNAFGRIIPAGGAAAVALQYRMLVQAGFPGGRIASALTGVSALLFGTVLALPLLSVPAFLAGAEIDPGLLHAAVAGVGVFVLTLAGGALVFLSDRPLRFIGALAERLLNRTLRRSRPVSELPETGFCASATSSARRSARAGRPPSFPPPAAGSSTTSPSSPACARSAPSRGPRSSCSPSWPPPSWG